MVRRRMMSIVKARTMGRRRTTGDGGRVPVRDARRRRAGTKTRRRDAEGREAERALERVGWR